VRHEDQETTPSETAGWSPDRPATVSKRTLVTASHAIEHAILSGPIREPTVVVALFQRLAYFEREYNAYARMAAAGVVVVIAFADGEAHQVPPGCQLVVLDPTEPLVDEWSVVAVAPEAGGYLVATDLHRTDPLEHSAEAGREFTGRWGYSRVQAANELARMRAVLGPRLDPTVAATIDRLLARVMPAGGTAAPSSGTDGERWATHSLHRMIERIQDVREGSRMLRNQLVDAHLAVSARAAAQVDSQSGLTTPEFLARWAGAGGPTALPVGVALFDVPGLDRAEERLGRRAAYHAARRAAAAVSEPLGPVDTAVRLSDREFALVVPGASSRHLAELVAAAAEQLELSSDGYPNVPLRARVASTVTRARPLPLEDLHLALDRPDGSVSTSSPDRIVVLSPAMDAPSAGAQAEDAGDGDRPPADDLHEAQDPPGAPGLLDRDPLGMDDLLAESDPAREPATDLSSDEEQRAAGTPAQAEQAGAPAVMAAASRRPTPARRRSGGEPGLSVLAGIPRRDRRTGDETGDDTKDETKDETGDAVGDSGDPLRSTDDAIEGDRPTAS